MGVSQNVKSALAASGSAPIFACRAWINFDGTTATPTIRASGNVSSITDNGSGNFTINFNNPMPDANFACCGMGSNAFARSYLNIVASPGPNVNSIQIQNTDTANGSLIDQYHNLVAVFR